MLEGVLCSNSEKGALKRSRIQYEDDARGWRRKSYVHMMSF
jgi:hypothetical protein